MSDAEGEAAETQVWVEFAVKCGYLERESGRKLYLTYEEIIKTLVGMITHADAWLITTKDSSIEEESPLYLDFL